MLLAELLPVSHFHTAYIVQNAAQPAQPSSPPGSFSPFSAYTFQQIFPLPKDLPNTLSQVRLFFSENTRLREHTPLIFFFHAKCSSYPEFFSHLFSLNFLAHSREIAILKQFGFHSNISIISSLQSFFLFFFFYNRSSAYIRGDALKE